MNTRQQIAIRVRIGFLAICLLGIAIISRAFYIQTYQGKYYIGLADSFTISKIVLPAERGNIYATDGRLLATSLPIFDLGLDVKTSLRNEKLFRQHIDSFSLLLSETFRDKTTEQYKNDILKHRKKDKGYYVIKRNIAYNTRLEMENWPLLRNGQYATGLVFDERKQRLKPFGWLADRTLGYLKKDAKGLVGVGLEKRFDSILTGKPGNTLAQKISGGYKIPLESPENVSPQPGKDLHTTIDIEFQDVAEDALHRALKHHGADHGCVILMECKTGKIRAIANLGRNLDSTYAEVKNYAIAEAESPGSTFKIATAAALVEDGWVTCRTKVDLSHGNAMFYGLPVRDHDIPEKNVIDFKRAIETSSNVAVAKLADKYYNHTLGKQKFYSYLEKFGFTQKIDIELDGTAQPVVRHYKKWTTTSIPFMAHGYEMQVTPLHILTFYNAIANQGVMVKPTLVEKITHYNTTIDSFSTVVINDKILSPKTIAELRFMLEGVVENGTAMNLKTEYLKVAGKTGTAKIAQGKEGYKTAVYQASFCGYFPAENPMYSMIVVVHSPTQNGYYGNKVAGTIFKEVADKVYSKSLKMQKPIQQLMAHKDYPSIAKGNTDDLKRVYALWYKKIIADEETWCNVKKDGSTIRLSAVEIENAKVPEVTGMGMRDAVYLLENAGLKVNVLGRGKVRNQSIKPGETVVKGAEITIELT
jgi:cell division protein FtsI (penicillin-binding protein 3)